MSVGKSLMSPGSSRFSAERNAPLSCAQNRHVSASPAGAPWAGE